jgi:ATP-dependent helicase/nuclease subunit A
MSEIKLTPAQQAAGVDLASQNVALRSGAGCGKTLVLARRFTELLLQSGDLVNPLRHFVALTFTDKAALEMSARVRRMLRQFAESAGSDADRHRLLDWIQQLPDARISTIHSFCASLLRSYAIEAGLDPAFQVGADTTTADALLDSSAEQVLLARLESDPAIADLVATAGLEKISTLLGNLITIRGQLDLDAPPDAEALLAHWRTVLPAARDWAWERLDGDRQLPKRIDELAWLPCSDPDDKLLPLRDQAVCLARTLLADRDAHTVETFAQLAGISPGSKGGKNAWTEPPKAVRDRIKEVQAALGSWAEFAEDLGPLDAFTAGQLATLLDLAGEVLAHYSHAKARRGLLDFDDLLVRTRTLLRDRPALAGAIGEGMAQLLIDEAQDTDSTQVDIVTALLGRAPWDDGRLFLVGDDKQSIYRFRGAQVEVFRDLCQQLPPRQQLDLDTSFRTHIEGVEFVNHLFAQLMGQRYQPLQAHRLQTPPEPAVEILLAEPSDEAPIDSADECIHAQALLTAQRIDQLLRDGQHTVWDAETETYRPARPGDIAILFVRMTHSLEFERQLQHRNLPYHVVGGTGFFKRQEIFDLLNALRVIESPADDIALLGLLRSAMVGLDDNALAHLARTHHRPYLPNLDLDALAELLEPPRLAQLRFITDLLTELHRQKDALAIDELLRRILDETGYEGVLQSQFQGRRLVGNVRQLLDQATAAGSELSLREFIDVMNRQTINEQRQEQAAVVGEGEDAISLMTIHKAKGLEFPIVFVPDLNHATQASSDTLLARRDWLLTAKPFETIDEPIETPPLSYRLAKRMEQWDRQEETLRMFYVALTRHEDRLILVGANWQSNTGLFKQGDCFLQKLDETFSLLDAIDRGRGELPFGPDNQYQAALRLVEPTPPQTTRRDETLLTNALNQVTTITQAAGVVETLASAGASVDLPLLGPLPAGAGTMAVAATALGRFQRCPLSYRWLYELRGPLPPRDGQSPPAAAAETGLDPMALGTVLHRCMELLDFANPQPAGQLLPAALAELDPTSAAQEQQTAALLDSMIATLRSSGLAGQLAAAEAVHREIDFTTPTPCGSIRGQIDLLYRCDGTWRVLDWKSDHLHGPADDKLRTYRLQLLLYADAAERITGEPPAELSLYFLRSGEMATIPLGQERLTQAREEIDELTARLARARREDRWPRCDRPGCAVCSHPLLSHLGQPATEV